MKENILNNEKLFREMFHFFSTPLSVVDVETWKILEVNQFFVEMFGFSQEEVFDKSPFFFCSLSCKEQAQIEQTIRNKGNIRNRIIPFTTKAGREFICGYSVDTITVENKPFALVSYVNQDNEICRPGMAARYRHMIDSASDLFAVLDPRGRFEIINQTAADCLSILPGEAVGKSLFDFLPEDYALRQLSFVQTVIDRGKGMVSKDIRIHQGQIHHFHTIWSPVKEPDGRVTGVLIVKRKIPDPWGLEDQMDQNHGLPAIGRLISGIAHDFNNLLGGILLNTELIERLSPPESRLRSFAGAVLTAGRRARDLVTQLLDFSRICRCEQEYIDGVPLVRESLETVRSSLPENIRLHCEIHVSNASIYSNPAHVQQVIGNLCSNAVHAMKKNGGRILVGLEEVYLGRALAGTHGISQGIYYQLTISDTGCGMGREVLDRVFEPFFTTRGPGEGLGMGLAVVYGIVTKNKGAIRIDSAEAKGCVVTILNPKREKPTPEIGMAATMEKIGRE